MAEVPKQSANARIKEIRADRSRRALRSLVGWIGVFQLLFWSFTFGYRAGPSKMPGQELIAGIAAALVLGVLLALLMNRYRLERDAKWMGAVREGARRRRVALFGDYFTVDREIVIASTVEQASLEGDALRLRYLDPVVDGPVLREFTGPRADLARLASALHPNGTA